MLMSRSGDGAGLAPASSVQMALYQHRLIAALACQQQCAAAAGACFQTCVYSPHLCEKDACNSPVITTAWQHRKSNNITGSRGSEQKRAHVKGPT